MRRRCLLPYPLPKRQQTVTHVYGGYRVFFTSVCRGSYIKTNTNKKTVLVCLHIKFKVKYVIFFKSGYLFMFYHQVKLLIFL